MESGNEGTGILNSRAEMGRHFLIRREELQWHVVFHK
jgi:hypothetical protein